MVAVVSGVVVIAIGVLVAVGGVWLTVVGGTWFYLVLAAGLMLAGALLTMRRRAALWVYGTVTLATLGWALGEVGFDWWQLAPRGDVVVLIGLWLLLPWVVRDLDRAREREEEAPPSRWFAGRAFLGLSLVLSLLVGAVAYATPSNGVSGQLPEDVVSLLPDDYGGTPRGEWRAYGATAYGDRYSPLDQITPENVDELQVAWTYHTGDLRREGDPNETTYEVTPLMIGRTLYLCTPHHLAIALDAQTGEERWRFDPEVGIDSSRQHQTCRGVAYHEAPAAEAGQGECPRRIFLPTADARLIVLDAETGEPCPGFGEDGTVDLWAGMPNVKPGFYYSTSPPVVTRGLVIVGGAVNDNVSVAEPSGVVRAYDVRSGELVWNWDSGNPEATEPIAPGETYTENSPNTWSVLSADETLGLVYVPMGTQPPDQWGGNRDPEGERFSSAVVALETKTGRVAWVFQTVHHDLWDMDVPAQPALLDLQIDQGRIPALVQATKQGDVFVLDRRNGEPVLPVEERPAPQGAAEGDFTADTQPVSALSFGPSPLTGEDMWGVTLFDQLACRIQFHSYRYEGRYTPPSTQGTLVHPGNFGVFNWGGVAVDPERQVMVATPSYLAFVSRLIPREDPDRNYVSTGDPGLNENYGAPFAVELKPFLSLIGLPCEAPPWGYVAGADLRTGEIAWMHKNGTVRDRAPVPVPLELGVPDLGGPMITAGGLFFMSGTLDYYVSAYDVTTGEQLWESRLPAGGQATPMSYRGPDGRQYVVVVAGGHGSLGTKAGDAIIAYALPQR